MVTYNIEIREFNGVDYDILHPVTTIENVEGLNNSLTQLSQNITNVSNALSNKVSKSGDTMTGNLTITNSQPIVRLTPRDTSKMKLAQITINNNNRFMFWQDTPDGNGHILYRLPETDTSATGNNYYDILTSQNFDDTPTAYSNNPVKSKGIKADLNRKVSKSGDTMTGNLAIKSSNIDTAATSIDSYTTSEFSIRDKNNKYVSYLLTGQATNGNINTALAARKIVNGANVDNSLTLKVNTNGTKGVDVSDPDAWRNGLGAQNGIWPISLGGTGITSNPSMLVNLASTSVSDVFATSPRPGVTGVLPIANGGTGNANGTVAKLTTPRTIRTNLGSTSTSSFDGSANITPGVTGTLQIANGGTGANNKKDALSNLGVTISNTSITEGSTLASGSIYIYYE